jgi:Animal haem peroxidase
MTAFFADHGSVGSPNEAQTSPLVANGRYCYIFPGLAKTESEQPPGNCSTYFENLDRLANLVDLEASDNRRKSTLPAIYTYFGQFINHDLSAPVATPAYGKSVSDKAKNHGSQAELVTAGPDAVALMTFERPPNPQWLVSNILNQHPEPLCLYSLYGTGPSSTDPEIQEFYDAHTKKFRLGRTLDDPNPQRPQSELDKMLHHDLVRDATRNVAKIADQRNDENVILSQLHLAFMLFHNRAIDALKPALGDGAELFNAARTLVTRHYQYCVVHDYLKHLVPNEALGSSVQLSEKNAVPFEFTTAAFRFGHSMISANYDYNRFFGDGGLEAEFASLSQLFDFTSRGNMGQATLGPMQLPTHWSIDWERFFKIATSENSGAEQIDPVVPIRMSSLGDVRTRAKMLHGLASISHRNLKRGYHRFMPSGQELAAQLGIAPLTPAQIIGAFAHHSAAAVLTETGFDVETPAWVYFLCEAKVKANGNALGPAAGAIVRGTIMELLRLNPESALNCDGGGWKPETSPLLLADGSAIKDIKSFLQFAGVLG